MHRSDCHGPPRRGEEESELEPVGVLPKQYSNKAPRGGASKKEPSALLSYVRPLDRNLQAPQGAGVRPFPREVGHRHDKGKERLYPVHERVHVRRQRAELRAQVPGRGGVEHFVRRFCRQAKAQQPQACSRPGGPLEESWTAQRIRKSTTWTFPSSSSAWTARCAYPTVNLPRRGYRGDSWVDCVKGVKVNAPTQYTHDDRTDPSRMKNRPYTGKGTFVHREPFMATGKDGKLPVEQLNVVYYKGHETIRDHNFSISNVFKASLPHANWRQNGAVAAPT